MANVTIKVPAIITYSYANIGGISIGEESWSGSADSSSGAVWAHELNGVSGTNIDTLMLDAVAIEDVDTINGI
jgi:hypothetical protein